MDKVKNKHSKLKKTVISFLINKTISPLKNRRKIPVEVFTRMQVQYGESQKEIGLDFDVTRSTSGIL